MNEKNSISDIRLKCMITGLKITGDSVTKVNGSVEYLIDELDILLMLHQDKFRFRLIDELYFSPNTIDVIEYDGESFAIKGL